MLGKTDTTLVKSLVRVARDVYVYQRPALKPSSDVLCSRYLGILQTFYRRSYEGPGS